MRLFGPTCTALVSTLTGCSLIYNPNNLPDQKIDAAPMIDAAPADVPADMPTDANVDMPIFMTAGPSILLEGQGTGGSRPAVLSIVGGNFGPDATVAIAPTAAADPPILIEVDNPNIVRSPSGTALAVPVTLPIDMMHGSAGLKDVPLTITVTQMGASQPITLMIPDQVILRNLPELTAAPTATTSLAPLYSQVKVTSAITFAASAAAVPPALIRAVGSIDLGDVHADGASGSPGPAGGAGGAGGLPASDGSGLGHGKAGSVLVGGSGGGYGAPGGAGAPLALVQPNPGGVMSGDDQITRYSNNTSGGGGGNGAVGGGGGGTLELSAGGTLSVAKVSANGAASSNGGGGSGGAIVLRAGGAATLKDAITAGGGAGGNSGGAGGLGRLRYDLSAVASLPAITAVKHAGVAFDSMAGSNPLITTDAHQRLRVISEAASTPWTVTIRDTTGATTSSSMITFASSSASITTTLSFGYNRVCVSPPMGDPSIVESTSCIDIAYVP